MKNSKGYKSGGLKMVSNASGKKVPFYAADGKGKMMGGGKVMRYDVGGLADIPVIRAPEGPIKRRPTPEEIDAGYEGLDIPEKDRTPKKKKKKPVKKNMGGMMKYANGGKVRGAGMARQGVRKAKMVAMKGS